MVWQHVKSILKGDMSKAALLASLLEGGMILALIWAMAQAHQHVEPPAIPVTLSFPVLPQQPKPEVKPPVKPPVHVAHPVAPRPVPTVQPPVPLPKTVDTPTPVPVVTPPKVVTQKTQQPAPKAPITPPAPPQPDPHILATFNDQVLGAVQSAVVYPYAARISHMHGRTRVGFTFLDGNVSNVTVLESSGYRLLDDAAVQAVMTAHYPAPPGNLKGQHLPFSLWVYHRLSEN
ncbi:MAG: TonB family protein [Pseudomonadales bacterium]|nr:TonB family protein [Pseudomonadales bacterium]